MTDMSPNDAKRTVSHIQVRFHITSKAIFSRKIPHSKVGDNVRIRECRPLSKRKRWEVVTEGA